MAVAPVPVVGVLRALSVTLVALVGLFGAAFIAAESLTDPGGGRGALLVTSWAIPLSALALVSLLKPALAARVLPVVLGFVGALSLIDAYVGVVDHDAWGPVGAIAVFAVAVPCGLLGLHRATAAGWLLLAAAGIQLLARLSQIDLSAGPSGGGALGGSSGALVMPLAVLGVLFLLVGASEPSGKVHQPQVLGR